MDSKQAEKKSIEKIKAAITSGDLTREEMMKRIKGAIAQEETKPIEQQDHEQILLYDQLLYELETGERYVSRRDEALRQVKARLAEADLRKARLRSVKRIAAVLAAVVVMVGGIELLHREWLYGRPSEDGQQFIIQGASIDPGLVAEGKANGNQSYKEIRTEQLEEVVPILGYKPILPMHLPAGWRLRSYFASNTATVKRFTASYQNDDEEYLLKYEERTYSTAERARAELEQNSLGESVDINGTKIYMVSNTSDPVFVWTNHLTYYSLYGPVPEKEMLSILDTLGG